MRSTNAVGVAVRAENPTPTNGTITRLTTLRTSVTPASAKIQTGRREGFSPKAGMAVDVSVVIARASV
jgi:hypothetical protein